jgi:hypothetical protein
MEVLGASRHSDLVPLLDPRRRRFEMAASTLPWREGWNICRCDERSLFLDWLLPVWFSAFMLW